MRRALAVLVGVVALMLPVPAHAENPRWHMASPVACLRPDFPVTGSGWKVQRAGTEWNNAQSVVRVVFSEPGCTFIGVHTYWNKDDGYCAYTTWVNGTFTAPATPDGAWVYTRADIWLNNYCRVVFKLSAWQTRVVVVHELGHSFGLPHLSHKGSVMQPGLDLYRRDTIIKTSDVAALAALYRT